MALGGFLKSIETQSGQTIGLIRENGQVEDCMIVAAGDIVPVSPEGQWFVDKGTAVPTADQTGSIAAPFATFAQAITAAQANYTALAKDQTIRVVPGDYSAEAPQVLNIAGKALAVVNWQLLRNNPTCSLPDLNVTGDVNLTAVFVANLVTTGFVVASKVQCNAVTCNGLQAYNEASFGGGTVTGLAEFNASPPGGVWTVTTASLVGCRQTGAVAFTGAVQLDGYTATWGRGFITGTSVTVFNGSASEVKSVVVPAVLAGNVGYVDTNMVGDLAAIATNAPVSGSPAADLVAAGAGGGFINCRVSAPGVVRCAFVGPLAGGAVNFTFSTPALA